MTTYTHSIKIIALTSLLAIGGCESDNITDSPDRTPGTITLSYTWPREDSKVLLPNGQKMAVQAFRTDHPDIINLLRDPRDPIETVHLDIADEVVAAIVDAYKAKAKASKKATLPTPSDRPVGIPVGDFYFRFAIETHDLEDCINVPAVLHINISISELFQPGTIANFHLAVWRRPDGQICLAYLITGSRFPDRPCRVICFPKTPSPDDVKATVLDGLMVVAEVLEATSGELGAVLSDAVPTAATVLGVITFVLILNLA